MKNVFLVCFLIICLAAVSAREESELVFFGGVCMTGSMFSGGAFTGTQFFTTPEIGTLIIPKLEPGIGWGATLGWKAYLPGMFKDLFFGVSLNGSQTFHAGSFGGRNMNVNSLLFSFGPLLGYRLIDWFGVYGTVGWIIPLFLNVDDGYELAGSYYSVSYMGIEGLEAGVGVLFTFIKEFSIFIEFEYRLTEYSNVSYADQNLRRTEYFGTSDWHCKVGILFNGYAEMSW